MEEAGGPVTAFEQWFKDHPDFRKDQVVVKYMREDQISHQQEEKAKQHKERCKEHSRKRFSDEEDWSLSLEEDEEGTNMKCVVFDEQGKPRFQAVEDPDVHWLCSVCNTENSPVKHVCKTRGCTGSNKEYTRLLTQEGRSVEARLAYSSNDHTQWYIKVILSEHEREEAAGRADKRYHPLDFVPDLTVEAAVENRFAVVPPDYVHQSTRSLRWIEINKSSAAA